MKYFLAAATLLASIAVATAAHAETPTCFGAKATIVGTDGDDTLHGTPHADVIVAGTGDDVVYGKDGNDRICGGGDDDVLYDGAGNDRVDGGVGIDRFIAGSGDDVMLGGDTHLPAFDSISYQNSPRPVVIDLRADTATGYGHDSVQHIWIAIGSRFDDVMRGTPRTDQFRGGCGDDRMFGKGGEDHLYGDSGGRECSGPATDNDVMYGGARHDYVFGEPADHIGTDRFYGGDGTDTFYSNARNAALMTFGRPLFTLVTLALMAIIVFASIWLPAPTRSVRSQGGSGASGTSPVVTGTTSSTAT